jgi:hypothetical protein
MGQNIACGPVRVVWNVYTYTLPSFLKRWSIKESDAFIKVDTESFECKLLGSWIEWLATLPGAKPSFNIAFHSQVVRLHSLLHMKTQIPS